MFFPSNPYIQLFSYMNLADSIGCLHIQLKRSISIIARTSGHLEPRTSGEASLRDYVASAMKFRREHPAMWRGTPTFRRERVADADVLIVDKTDAQTGDRVVIVFSDKDTTVPLIGLKQAVDVDAWRPEFVAIIGPEAKRK